MLKDLINQTQIDIIESLHPPPMCDLPTGEAFNLWIDKVIRVGFPGSVYILGPEATKEHALNLIRDLAPGNRLCVAISSENLVSNENLIMLTSVLENAGLPLSPEKINRIQKALVEE